MSQYHTIVTAEPMENYNVRVVFNDGTSGIVSFAEDVQTGVFRKIAEPSTFNKVKIEQFGTVLTWDIDVPELEKPDACADWLYNYVTKSI